MRDDRSTPGVTASAIAATIAWVNALWTVLLLGGAIIYESTCGDNASGSQQCGGGLGLGMLWLMGQLVLGIPAGWAGNLLVAAERRPNTKGIARVGLVGIAAIVGIPVSLVLLLIVLTLRFALVDAD